MDSAGIVHVVMDIDHRKFCVRNGMAVYVQHGLRIKIFQQQSCLRGSVGVRTIGDFLRVRQVRGASSQQRSQANGEPATSVDSKLVFSIATHDVPADVTTVCSLLQTKEKGRNSR